MSTVWPTRSVHVDVASIKQSVHDWRKNDLPFDMVKVEEISCSDQEMSSKTTETCSSSTAWWWRRRMRILCSILARQVQVQLVASDWPMRISMDRDDHGPVQPYFVSCYIIYLIRPAPHQRNAHIPVLMESWEWIGRHSTHQVEQLQLKPLCAGL